tara:strand:- start:12533 stop:14341 length:1809 start_codon:yes stop_codon:yes gene_type:complete
MKNHKYKYLPKLSQSMIPQVIIQQLIVFLFLGFLVSDIIEKNYLKEKREELRLASKLIEKPLIELLNKKQNNKVTFLCKDIANTTNSRITIILKNGFVIGDSHKNPDLMDNHITRPEIIKALNNEIGISRRFSDSMNEKMFYFASAISFNKEILIIRTSFPETQLKKVLNSARIKLGIVIILAIIISGITLFVMGEKIVKPIDEMRLTAEKFSTGDFSSKISNQSTFELGALAESFNKMSNDLKYRIDKINNEKNEKSILISNMVEGLAMINSKGEITLYNDSFIRILKIEKKINNKVLFENIILEKKLKNIIRHSIAKGIQNQLDMKLNKFSIDYVQITITPIRKNKDKKFDVILMINDISRLMMLERVRKDFVSNVSHELKTPLTVINGYVETIQNEKLNKNNNFKLFLKKIESNSKRMDLIIDDLLLLSRIEANSEEDNINKTSSSIREIIKSSFGDIKNKYKNQNKIEIKDSNVEINCLESIYFKVNIELLRQAISNLIDNAIKYGGFDCKIKIQAKIKKQNLFIDVHNSNSFIKKEKQIRVFERFYRVDKARSRDHGGTGLGLAIVKHIVLAHGGQVNVQSNEKDGTCFKIEIPKEI